MRWRRFLAITLAVLAPLLLIGLRSLERGDKAPLPRLDAPPPVAAPGSLPGSGRWLVPLDDPALEAQVARVVASFDTTGRPPSGVSQGGRRDGRRGVFENAERKLPRQAPGYYSESDVWPRGSGGRGAERLIFGKSGEVYYTADHYRRFVRLR